MRSAFASSHLRERLQARVEAAGGIHIARCTEVRFEVALELEHVAEVVGAGEPEARGNCAGGTAS